MKDELVKRGSNKCLIFSSRKPLILFTKGSWCVFALTPATSKMTAMKLQGELGLLKTELKSLHRELSNILDGEEFIELREFLKMRWPNVWEDYLKVQKARTRLK